MPTINELLTRALPADRARAHLDNGYVRVGDTVVYNPDTEIADHDKTTITLRPPRA